MNYLKPLALVIFLYVMAFVVWWIVLLTRLENENHQLQQNIHLLAQNSYEQSTTDADLMEENQRAVFMIISEGLVFLAILFISFWYLFKTINKEERLNRLQHNFLLATTHELKTPLATTKLNLQTLTKPALPEDKKSILIENSLHEMERLNQLVNNILISSKLEDGAEKVTIEPINLSEFLEQYAMDHKDTRLHFNIAENTWLHGDRDALIIIVNNLISNALKYSNADDDVIVECLVVKDTPVIRVVDCGVGIPKNERKEIFKRFYRVGNEKTRKTSGTGLGLFLSKQLIQLMHGQIEVQSNEPRGSIFEVKFPKFK